VRGTVIRCTCERVLLREQRGTAHGSRDRELALPGETTGQRPAGRRRMPARIEIEERCDRDSARRWFAPAPTIRGLRREFLAEAGKQNPWT